MLEPITLLVAVILLGNHILKRGYFTVVIDAFAILLLFITVWTLLNRPWAVDWKNGLSDARDWLVPLVTYIALITTIRTNWRKWILLFLFLVVFNALFGIIQHFTNDFRPFITELSTEKVGFLADPVTGQIDYVSYTVAFFSHPNGLAQYLFMGLMIALGFLSDTDHKFIALGIIVVIGLALVWSYAKASLLIACFSVLFYYFQRRVKSNVLLTIIGGAGLVLILIAASQITNLLPNIHLGTFQWRLGLWSISAELIESSPEIILFGNGLDRFANMAFYPQPHNLYIYTLLQFGLIGLLWILLLFIIIYTRGMKIRNVKSKPFLPTLWVALIGFLAIGFVESNLYGVELRTIFVIVLALFAGYYGEFKGELILQSRV